MGRWHFVLDCNNGNGPTDMIGSGDTIHDAVLNAWSGHLKGMDITSPGKEKPTRFSRVRALRRMRTGECPVCHETVATDPGGIHNILFMHYREGSLCTGANRPPACIVDAGEEMDLREITGLNL